MPGDVLDLGDGITVAVEDLAVSSKRAPMAPPDLPGFTYVDILGSGGFADVYLYEQQLPKRRVAVKVLIADRMSSGSAEEFTAEANVMAMLSTHPAIVTIYQAGVARDGRPYLVMEYCPKPNLQVRYRREPFSVAESLRVGIQVAAAVETAHRAGVLHRDIKPANILVTEYNRPGPHRLRHRLDDERRRGVGGAVDPLVAARVVRRRAAQRSALRRLRSSARRSTRCSPDARRSSWPGSATPPPSSSSASSGCRCRRSAERMRPTSLERALERAMAKSPADRYESALAFARALQKVQIELSHSVTPIDILDDARRRGRHRR